MTTSIPWRIHCTLLLAVIDNTTGGAESTTRGVNPNATSIVPTVTSSILVNRSSSRGSMSNQPKSKANSDEVSCYVCKQSRPCERGTHEKFVRPIQGPLKEAWGLGSVWVACCGSIYGMYYNDETTRYDPVFLGNSEGEAMSRVNLVISFL